MGRRRMISVQQVEQMLDNLANGHDIVMSRDDIRNLPHEHTIVCHFDFEPRIRYTRHVIAFRSLLNDNTDFHFDIASIARGCIDVCYIAEDFSLEKKNDVRRQVECLMKGHNLRSEFDIISFLLFGRLKYFAGEQSI